MTEKMIDTLSMLVLFGIVFSLAMIMYTHTKNVTKPITYVNDTMYECSPGGRHGDTYFTVSKAYGYTLKDRYFINGTLGIKLHADACTRIDNVQD